VSSELFAEALASSTFRAAQRAGVRVTVETNVTPPMVLYDVADTGPSILDVLGIKSHVTVTTSEGKELAEFGAPVERNVFLMAAYGAVIVLGLIAFGAMVSRVLR
jgi:hypothetical protein